MQVGDLVRKTTWSDKSLFGIVIADGKKHVKVFWNQDYGVFWTEPKSLTRLSNNEKGL
jgi:hypothetical protein